MTLGQLKKDFSEKLKNKSPSPQLDMEVLIEHFTGLSKTRQLLNRDLELSPENQKLLEDALKKRLTGLPVAYITGHKEFFGYDFLVNPSVLIPKPDTEILVERAIDLIIGKMEARPDCLLTICDMCTGSGCIGLSVLKSLIEVYKIPSGHLPKITMIDISADALEVAEKNIEHLGLPRENLRLVRSNLFEQFSSDGGWTYIPHTLVDKLLKDGRNEPRLALDGDITLTGDRPFTMEGEPADDGLEIIRNLIPQAKAHLSPKGIILMETGEYNAEESSRLAKSYNFRTQIHPDLEGQLRVVEMY